jgi:hypothetical protein
VSGCLVFVSHLLPTTVHLTFRIELNSQLNIFWLLNIEFYFLEVCSPAELWCSGSAVFAVPQDWILFFVQKVINQLYEWNKLRWSIQVAIGCDWPFATFSFSFAILISSRDHLCLEFPITGRRRRILRQQPNNMRCGYNIRMNWRCIN